MGGGVGHEWRADYPTDTLYHDMMMQEGPYHRLWADGGTMFLDFPVSRTVNQINLSSL